MHKTSYAYATDYSGYFDTAIYEVGEDMNKWGEAAFAESTRQFKEHQCLDRYMEENYPFAQALTACKQEALLP